MDGTPQRKKARFSEHPQIFEYSSRSKKEGEGDNQSLLLDSQQYGIEPRVQQKQQIDSNPERQLQIDQITSDLAQIEAYLNQQSKPIQQNMAPNQSNLTPIKEPKKEKQQRNQRFSISINPQLKSGRETMNLEQQMKVKSTLKDLPNDISNNKKRAMKQQNKQKTIEQRIQKEMKKNKRITMDTKQLMDMLNEYKTQIENKKAQDQRKNRITMDVFALTKLIETAAEQEADEKSEFDITPLKINQKSGRKSKVFSAFKQSPHKTEVKLIATSYLADAGKRLQQKINQNKKTVDYLSQLKSEVVKMDLKILDAKKKVEKRNRQNLQLQRKLKFLNHQLDKYNPVKDCQKIRQIQAQLDFRVLKFDVNEQGCYGHFIFDEIFLKAKSKGKNGPVQLKFMIPLQVKSKQKFFLISNEDITNILKKYNSHLIEKEENFIQKILRLRKACHRIKKLDQDLYYLSVCFDLRQFQLTTNLDRLNFQVFFGNNLSILVQLNMSIYLTDELDSKSVTVYDPKKSSYINLDTKAKENDSILFEKIKILINSQLL